MKTRANVLLTLLISIPSFFYTSVLCAQTCTYGPSSIHSHNDYVQPEPLFNAYRLKAGIIEADVFLVDGQLMVAHEHTAIRQENTLDKMYLSPILALYKDSANWHPFILMIDMKQDAEPSLKALMKTLDQEEYAKVFRSDINKKAVRIVISGNRPKPAHYRRYPNYISFDGRPNETYTPKQLQRIAFISDGFNKYGSWKGVGAIESPTFEKMQEAVQKSHKLGKPFRFWGMPDTNESWNLQMELYIDYIGADDPKQLLWNIEHRSGL